MIGVPAGPGRQVRQCHRRSGRQGGIDEAVETPLGPDVELGGFGEIVAEQAPALVLGIAVEQYGRNGRGADGLAEAEAQGDRAAVRGGHRRHVRGELAARLIRLWKDLWDLRLLLKRAALASPWALGGGRNAAQGGRSHRGLAFGLFASPPSRSRRRRSRGPVPGRKTAGCRRSGGRAPASSRSGGS